MKSYAEDQSASISSASLMKQKITDTVHF